MLDGHADVPVLAFDVVWSVELTGASKLNT